MRLIKTNLSLFAYDPNKNYSAEMKAIEDKPNKTDDDYKKLAQLEREVNEKVADMDKNGTNTYGAKQSSKYQDIERERSGSNSGKPSYIANINNTYTPIDTSGIDWDKMSMSSDDYAKLSEYGRAWTAAQAAGDQEAMNRYHDLAEGIRSKYNYSGGRDGSQYLPWATPAATQMTWEDNLAALQGYVGAAPEFNYGEYLSNNPKPTFDASIYGKAPTWDDSLYGEAPTFDASIYGEAPTWDGSGYIAPEFSSQWTDEKNRLARAYLDMNYGDFLNTQQYKEMTDRYGTAGQRAMQDTLGQVSARTGGLASSYAAAAAQQQYNNYMQQLTQAAYDMYAGELQNAYNRANAAAGYEQTDYNRYLDSMDQFYKDRDWDRSMYLDDLDKYYRDRDFGYGMFLDDRNQWNADRAFAYGAYQDDLDKYYKDRDFGYGMYLDELGQWNTDVNRAYGIYQDDVSQWNNNRGFAADAISQDIAQSNRNQEWDYGVAQDTRNDARDRIDSFLAAGGRISDLDPDLVLASGYSSVEVKQLQDYYQSKLNGSSGGGSRSGGGGRKSGSGSSGDIPSNWDELSAAVGNPLAGSLRRENGNLGGSDEEVIANAYDVYTGAAKKLSSSGSDDALTYLASRAGSNDLFRAYADALGISDDQINVWLRRKGY